MNLPTLPRGARLPFFARLCTAFVFVAGLAALAPAAHAIEIQVEVAFDSLAQPPAPLSNICTLRKAVNNANDNDITYPQCQGGEASPVVDTIVFNVSGPITFALAGANENGGETGDLDVTDDLTIFGHPDGTTIDAADLDRVFHVHPGVTLTLVNIHITNGNASPGGGGIYVEAGATLNLNGVTVSNCFTGSGDGGGIFADSATLNITNSTVSGNMNVLIGAGMAVQGGTTNITNSTITANHNQTGLAGGISAGGTVNLRSSIIAGNTNDSLADTSPNITGNINSLGYNVIGHLGTPPNNAVYVAHPTDQVGVTDAQANLGPLQNNGGPTPTHAPSAGSVAIDKGHSTGATADQRGLTRPCDLPAVANASGGDGGDAGAVEVQGACVVQGAPDAVDDAASVAEDSAANPVSVLANDTDPDADTLTVTAVTQGAHGSVAITGGGTGVSYTPAPNYFGPDSFTYTAADGNGGTDTATVSVTVTSVEDPPVAVDDAANVSEDSGPNLIGVLANDFDVDGDALTVSAVGPAANGVVSNNTNSVSYTPNPNYFGPDSFTYTVTDGHGNTASATVNVNVANVNDAPAALSDNYSMSQDTVLNVPAAGVLANDSDLDGDGLTAAYVAGNGPHNGTVTVSPDGSFEYTPNPGFTGLDTFDYVAGDGTENSNVATVTVKVNDTQAPVVNCSVTKALLWPPNSDLVNVGLQVSASDNDGQPPAVEIAVFSDEDDEGQAAMMSPDAKNVAPSTLRLRAERDGAGDGRVYVIRIKATDTSNNVSYSYCTVVVPKSQSKADLGAANAQAAAAVAAFDANGDNPPAGFFLVGDGPVIGPKQ
ncbi:MAG TPA: Ig-like domain-containing protein [Pyrinomonadaceae bacterium]|nr:Ig-like domain-containing protein [Pyrinomonadaceae bacterium]